jgi:LPXTG-motif cell wall-anchored protein
MKKIIVAATAAFALALAPLSAALAFDTTVGGHTWTIDESYFGVEELDGDDVFDSSYLKLSTDGGATSTPYECRDESLMSETVTGTGKVVTCNELVTVVNGLNVRGYAYVYPDGLLATTTYTITNTTGSAITFNWFQEHDYGNGEIGNPVVGDIYSVGDGSNNPDRPAAIAWGPTTQACSADGLSNDGYDEVSVISESCTLAAGATTAVAFYHMVGSIGSLGTLQSNANSFFNSRSYDSTLVQGIPAGVVAANWGLTGAMVTTNVPAAADPFDATETMTLTGDAVLGNNMTIAFKNVAGNDPVGDYYDVWMCPNKDVKPVDLGVTGDCVPVTFWNRAVVANYSQNTTALTMTWKLANEPVPGLIAAGGASYLDGSGEPITMDPPTEDGGWCAYEGWFMIVNDYDGGAHSNWSPAIGAAGCSEPAAGLANTGVDTQQTGLIGLFALLAGLGVVVARRRAVRSN